MIALLCAVAAEVVPVLTVLRDLRRAGGKEFDLWEGRAGAQSVLVCRSGMGREAAETATRYLLDHCQVHGIVSFGFAGALVSGWAVGDVVVPDRFINLTKEEGVVEKLTPDPDWFSIAHTAIAGSEATRIGLVTFDRIVGDPGSRRNLAQSSGAQLVDMESFWVARVSADKVPFLGIRAVSDRIDHRVPPFDTWNGIGGMYQAIHHFIRTPAAIIDFAMLGANVMRAQSKLREAMRLVLAKVDQYFASCPR